MAFFCMCYGISFLVPDIFLKEMMSFLNSLLTGPMHATSPLYMGLLSLLMMEKPRVMTPARCEVQIACKLTCQMSFQRVKKGRRSFTVGHTGIKYHNLSISSHLNQNYWHVFWNPFSGSLWKTTFGKITTSLNVKQSISTIPNFFQNFSFITLLPDCKAVNASFRRVTGNVGF